MLGHTDDEREGALLRRLKEAGRAGSSGRMGFATGGGDAKHRPVIVVARTVDGTGLRGRIAALAEAGADAVEIEVHGRAGDLDIGDAGVPCGLYVSDRTTGDVLASMDGFDWLHLNPTAPARLLAGRTVTRLVSISPDLPTGRLPGLLGLQADIVVIEGAAPTAALTVETLLAIGTIQGATKRPSIVGANLGITPDDVAVLHEHGADGLVVAGEADTVRAFVRAVEAL